MVPSTHVPFILFSTLSRSCNTQPQCISNSSALINAHHWKPMRALTTLHSSCTSCCMKLSSVSHLHRGGGELDIQLKYSDLCFTNMKKNNICYQRSEQSNINKQCFIIPAGIKGSHFVRIKTSYSVKKQ